MDVQLTESEQKMVQVYYTKRWIHIERVVELCSFYCKKANQIIDTENKNRKKKEVNPLKKIDESTLYTAAILHDIAKVKNGSKKHHKPEKVKEACEEAGIDTTNITNWDSVCDNIIQYHRKGFKPTEFHLEAAILRMCDKIDKLSREEWKDFSAYQESYDKIVDFFSGNKDNLIIFKKVFPDNEKELTCFLKDGKC